MARTTRRRAATAPPGDGAEQRRARENLPRPAAAPVSAGVPRPAATPKKRANPFGFLARLQPRFIADVIAETRKVTWPTFAETRYLTIVVAVVATVVGLFLGGIDLAFGWIIEKLFF